MKPKVKRRDMNFPSGLRVLKPRNPFTVKENVALGRKLRAIPALVRTNPVTKLRERALKGVPVSVAQELERKERIVWNHSPTLHERGLAKKSSRGKLRISIKGKKMLHRRTRFEYDRLQREYDLLLEPEEWSPDVITGRRDVEAILAGKKPTYLLVSALVRMMELRLDQISKFQKNREKSLGAVLKIMAHTARPKKTTDAYLVLVSSTKKDISKLDGWKTEINIRKKWLQKQWKNSRSPKSREKFLEYLYHDLNQNPEKYYMIDG